ncbi:MAG: M23 family metallopeptidase [Deltaproteobacteria bacterium]|nr:M23 family metallopeptidase [Deltaproteobacteria bacterium]
MRLLVLVWVGVRPENSMRLDRRVDLRTSKEVSPAVSDDDGEITTEAALSQKGKGADFIWPVEGGVLTSRFGIRKGRSHDGIDISARRGTPVKASADGKVVYSGRLAGYGNLIVLKHDGNLFTAYAHAEKNRVKKGDKVRQGEVIATVGRTGHATGPHCHFEIRQKTEARNPLYFLPKTDAYAGN